ncbi:MAG: hypothetical protein RLZZ511_1490 [Cyanobacteriota bacterium]|jgi:hypothetical protein
MRCPEGQRITDRYIAINTPPIGTRNQQHTTDRYMGIMAMRYASQ